MLPITRGFTMATKSRCSSAADIVIAEDMLVSSPVRPACATPVRTPDPIPATDVDAIFVRLRALKREFGAQPNMHELAQALIGACIHEGFDTRARIVAALHRLDLKKAHVVLILNDYEGVRWRRDGAGVYHLLDNEGDPATSEAVLSAPAD
jgi:hypothetical protein